MDTAGSTDTAPGGLAYGRGRGPLAVAHRGGAGLAPENTFAAFDRSHALGIRYLETDLRSTSDGVCVAFHDERLDRVTDGRGRLSERTWADLSRLRVAGGARVPSFAELLEAFPHARFAVDVKDAGVIRPLAELLRRTGAAERVCVGGAWDGWLNELRERTGPALASALGWRGLSVLLACARAGVAPPRAVLAGSFVHVPVRVAGRPVFSERVAQAAHGLGLRVLVWTVDKPAVMHRLLDAGADGVITDRPDLLREVLVARGSWPAMGTGSLASASDLTGTARH